MPKLSLFVGLPFSGKTTFSKKIKKRVIHIDELRYALTGSYHFKNNHFPLVQSTLVKTVGYYLKQGEDVIVDGMFLTNRSRQTFIKVAKTLNIEIDVIWFDVSFDVLKSRLQVSQMRNENIKNLNYTMLEELSNTFEIPTLEEGFSHITYLSNNDLF